MEKLIKGIVDFRNNVRPQYRDTFARLALGQKPDALLISCSDSRVAVNLFASTEPGDLFVVRNVGNIIPACCAEDKSESTGSEEAALEFALGVLNVRDIIVCGHSECGAMQALDRGRDKLESPYLKNWLKNVEETPMEWDELDGLPESSYNRLSQKNVLLQMKHLKSYPLVQKKIKENGLKLHGWWFELSKAEVYSFDEAKKTFVVIDEKEAARILTRLT